MGSRAKSKGGSGGGDRAQGLQYPAKIFGPGRKRGGQPTEHKGLYKRDEQEEVGSYKSRGAERLGGIGSSICSDTNWTSSQGAGNSAS